MMWEHSCLAKPKCSICLLYKKSDTAFCLCGADRLFKHIPANTGHSPNAVPMLAHRLRRWSSIETSLGECAVFAGHWARSARLWLSPVNTLRKRRRLRRCRAKPKCSICSLYKWAYTAFWLCRAAGAVPRYSKPIIVPAPQYNQIRQIFI